MLYQYNFFVEVIRIGPLVEVLWVDTSIRMFSLQYVFSKNASSLLEPIRANFWKGVFFIRWDTSQSAKSVQTKNSSVRFRLRLFASRPECRMTKFLTFS